MAKTASKSKGDEGNDEGDHEGDEGDSGDENDFWVDLHPMSQEDPPKSEKPERTKRYWKLKSDLIPTPKKALKFEDDQQEAEGSRAAGAAESGEEEAQEEQEEEDLDVADRETHENEGGEQEAEVDGEAALSDEEKAGQLVKGTFKDWFGWIFWSILIVFLMRCCLPLWCTCTLLFWFSKMLQDTTPLVLPEVLPTAAIEATKRLASKENQLESGELIKVGPSILSYHF